LYIVRICIIRSFIRREADLGQALLSTLKLTI